MVAELLAGIAIVVPILQGAVGKKLEHRDLALIALYAALTETEKYMSRVPTPERAKAKKEKAEQAKLAALWFKASISIRHFDTPLANLCEHKRDYWANPAGWCGDDKINDAIRLEAMTKKFEKMRASILTAFIGV